MEIIMLQSSPVRLDDHRCLQNRDLCRVSASSPPFPWLWAIPVDIYVGPDPVIPTGFTPCVHLCSTFTMQCLRGLKGAIRVGYQRMEIEMTTENVNHRFTFLLCRRFQSSSLLDVFTL